MQVILLENIKKLGNLGEIVTVKDGYGRNYLIPQNKALAATAKNKQLFEARKVKIEAENQEKVKKANLIAEELAKIGSITLHKQSEEGRLYASVRASEVVKYVEDKHKIKLNKSTVKLPSVIKELGQYKVSFILFQGIAVELDLIVDRQQIK